MTKKELRVLQKGLDEFPKVIARKKRAFIHKQKMLKAFAPLSKELFKKEELRNKKLQLEDYKKCGKK